MVATRDFSVVALLLCVALAVGGAGSYYPRLELLLELVAIGTLAYFALSQRRWALDRLSWFAIAIALAALLLPLAQLIPLPPALWHALPGREFAVDLDGQLGWQGRWRPLSLDPGASLRSALSLLPPLAMLVGIRFLNTQERVHLVQLLVAGALFSALLGCIQFATGGKLTPYPSAHLGYPIGLFVNRNHQAALLLVALPLLAALGALRPPGRGAAQRLILTLALCLILSVVVIATSSRMGSALLVLSLGTFLFLLFSTERLRRLAAPVLVGAGLFAVLLLESGPFARLLGRFSSLNDGRFGYWQDLSFVFDKFGFAGTGFGTFVPLQQSMESLDHISTTYLNHAHNDFLEVGLEGGLPAIVLMVLFSAFLIIAAKALLTAKASPHRRLLSAAACCGILCLLLFSLVDYPLRMPALSTAFALLCGLLLPRTGEAADRQEQGRRTGENRSRSRLYYAIAAAALIFGWLATASASAEADIIAQRYSSAIDWAPWSSDAYARRADLHLSRRELAQAAADASSALGISPLQVTAIRTLGLVDMASGYEATGDQLMLIAARLGWRDPITQLWAAEALLRTGQPAKAAQRMQALLHQGDLPPSILTAFAAEDSSAALDALAAALVQDDDARKALVKLAAKAEPAQFGIVERMAEAMSNSRRPLSATELEPILRRLSASGGIERAQRVWRASRGKMLIANGGFDTLDAARRLPLGWSVSSGLGGSMSVAVPPGRRGVALRLYQPANSTSAISQLLMLEPGPYMATYLSTVAANGPRRLQLRLACVRSNSFLEILEAPVPAASNGWHAGSFSFLVPERDCPIQRLSLVLKNPLNRPVTDWIDDVRLQSSREGVATSVKMR